MNESVIFLQQLDEEKQRKLQERSMMVNRKDTNELEEEKLSE